MYRSPLYDIDLGEHEDKAFNDQSMAMDFVDSVQRGFYQGMAGTFETIDQLTGYGGGIRNWLNERADAQISEMSEAGQNALTQQIFTEDENGDLTFGEGALNGRAWLNYLGQGVGTVGSFLGTGGAGSVMAKSGAKALATVAGKKAIEKAATKKAAELGFRGKAKEIVANGAIGYVVGNGMTANGERERYQNMSFDELQNSTAFSDMYWSLRKDPLNEQFTNEDLGIAARNELAERAADRAFSDPRLIAINTIGGLSGAVGGRGLGITGNIFNPSHSLKGGLAKGFAIEGTQEASQGGVEALVSNEVYRDLVDPNYDISTGVASSALNEGVIGGVLGGTVNGAEGFMAGRRNRNAIVEDAVPVEQVQQPEVDIKPQELSPEQRAVEEPITGNTNLDTELNRLDDSNKAVSDALAGAKQRKIENELSARRTATRAALQEKVVLPVRNEQQNILDLARAYDPDRYQSISRELSNPDIDANQDYAEQLEGELIDMARQATELNIDPLQTSIDRRVDANRRGERSPEQILRQRLLRYGDNGVLHDAEAAYQQAQAVEQQQSTDVSEDVLQQQMDADARAKYGLPNDYQPTEAAQRVREEQGIALRDELEYQDVRQPAQQINPSDGPTEAAQRIYRDNVQQDIDLNQQSIPARRDMDAARIQQESDQAIDPQQQLSDEMLNRLASERVSNFSNRPASMKLREDGRKPIRDYAGMTEKTKGMSKRLKRRIQRAKGFNTNAVLSEFQNHEKRLQAFEAEAKRQAQIEATKPENVARRKSAEALFEERMTSPQATEFKENLITEAMNSVNDIVDSSQGTVLEIDGNAVSLPEVKRQLANGVRNLANKFISKEAVMTERLRRVKQQRETQNEQMPNVQPDPESMQEEPQPQEAVQREEQSVEEAQEPTSQVDDAEQGVELEQQPELDEAAEPTEETEEKPASSAAYRTSLKKVVSSAKKEEVEGFVKDIFKGTPDLAHAETMVKVVNSERDLPHHIQYQIFNDGVEGRVNGLYDPVSKSVYLVADKIESKEDAERFIFHELVGHHGLRQLFGSDITKELMNIRNLLGGKSGILKLARKMDVDLSQYVEMAGNAVSNNEISTEQADFILFDELLAHVAERNQVQGALDRLLQKVKEWLRRNGFTTLAGYGKSDLISLLTNIRTSLNESANSSIASEPSAQNSGVSYAMASDFKNDLAKAMTSLKSRVPAVNVMQTPDVLKALGVPDLPITITRDVVRKATNGVKDDDHAIDMGVIEQLPELLSDPIAVFRPKNDSIAGKGGKNIVVEARLPSGKPVLVALHSDVENYRLDIDRIEVNKIASAYGKDTQTLNNWAKDGLLEYVRSKNPEWLRLQGLQLPKERTFHQGSGKSVLTKEDVVKKGGGVSYSLTTTKGNKSPSLSVLMKQSKLVQAIKLALTDNKLGEYVGANKYALFTLRQLGQIATSVSKPIAARITQYIHTIDEMLARQNQLLEEAHTISDEFSDWARKNRAQADQLFEFMHDSTLADVDPSKPLEDRRDLLRQRIDDINRRINVQKGASDLNDTRNSLIRERKELEDLLKREPFRIREHARLNKQWGALSQEQQSRYIQGRDHYIKQTDQLNQALEENINRSIQDNKIKKELLLKLRQRQEIAAKGLYFPLSRHGDYWVDYPDSKGERQFEMFESRAAMEAAKERLKAEGIEDAAISSGVKLDEGTFKNVSLPFISDVVGILQSAKMNDVTKQHVTDEVYQLYLRTLPERSLRRNYIHRKGVAGFSNDAIRTMADNGFKFARQQSRLEFGDQLDSQLQEMIKEAKSAQHGVVAGRLVNELSKRHEWVKNPQRSGLAQWLTGLGFSFLLGGSPAAALVNLTQLIQVAVPVLGASHGMQAAASELAIASKQFLKNARKEVKGKGHMYSSLTDQEKRAMDKAIRAGAIDTTQAHDLLGLAENPNATYNNTQHKIMSWVGFMFHKAEVLNREVTFMASYRLNMKKLNDHDKAVGQAINDVWESHFDYGSHNRARFMQSDFMAVAFQFKQYAQQMTYYLVSNLVKTFKGETPEVKREAMRKLLGTLTATFAIGGFGALPISMIAMAANAAAAAFGDDDEPFDAVVEMQQLLTEWVGEDTARHLWYGTLPSISSRTGLNGLWFQDLREDDMDDKYMEILKQVAGPVVGGVFFNTTQGITDGMAGHHWRGLEKMMPVAARNLSKTARYIHDEGVLTKNADVILPWDDIDALELGGQALGFNIADAAIQYEKNSASYEYVNQATKRRQSLMNAYYAAHRLEDRELMSELREEIDKFNRSEWGKANPITNKSIKLSISARERGLERSLNGVRVNPKYHQLIKENEIF